MSRVPSKIARGFARLRERNQLTLPQAVVDSMGLGLGDLVEFAATDQGTIEVRPARIVTVGTPEAQREEEAGREDIRQGRYSVIGNLDEFKQHMDRVRQGERPAASEVARAKEAPGEAFALDGMNHETVAVAGLAERFGLTPREHETVRLLLEGLTSKEIAKRMNISINTVKAWMRLVMIKMKVSTRSGIVEAAAGSHMLPNVAMIGSEQHRVGHLSAPQRQEVEAIVEAVLKKFQSGGSGSRNILSGHGENSVEQR